DVDANDRVRRRAVDGALVEAEQLLARPNAPHSDSPSGARARHEPAAVRGKRDVREAFRRALRARQRQHLAAARRRDIPDPRLSGELAPAGQSRPVPTEGNASDRTVVAAEPEHLAQLAVGDLPYLRDAVDSTGGQKLAVAAELDIKDGARVRALRNVELPAVRETVELQRPQRVTGDEQAAIVAHVDVDRLGWPGRIAHDAHLLA